MHKLLALLLCLSIASHPKAQQQKLNLDPAIAQALQDIRDFNIAEGKLDSAAGHLFGSYTEDAYLRRFIFYNNLHQRLNSVDTTKLSFDDQVNIALLQYDIEEEVSSYIYKAYLNPILSDEGFHTGLPGMGSEQPSTIAECNNYIARLKDMPRYVAEHLDLMRSGLKLGICQPKSILDGYEHTYEQHIVNSPEKSVFYKPFLQKPANISDADWADITTRAKQAVMNDAVEAFRSIKTFFDKEYLPHTRTTIGVSNFPDGLAYYQDRVHHYTSTNISYEEIYQLGLTEVARIKKEMLDVIKQAGFTGSFEEFITYLRTDPKFYATTADQLLKEASFIAKKADGMLPSFFGKLPRQPYDVQPVPDYLAPTYTAGRYAGASIYGKRAAHYWVNTYDLRSRPLYNLEALTMHEAVPGHHIQISLAQELTNLPDFRHNLYVNAFGEGWGLYCEYLGTEMGFYKDPYSHFGRLTYEMWRACRLVLDVGLHTKGWTREQAVTYLSENTALSIHEVNTEVNRYIAWPGQALAYKIGELKIKELRKRAEDELKDKFDIREFHDLVLSRGSVTMAILEKMVDRYIEQKVAGSK